MSREQRAALRSRSVLTLSSALLNSHDPAPEFRILAFQRAKLEKEALEVGRRSVPREPALQLRHLALQLCDRLVPRISHFSGLFVT